MKFEHNFDKATFKIEINVKENCLTFNTENLEDYKASYFEIVGVLEVVKHRLFQLQTEENLKDYVQV